MAELSPVMALVTIQVRDRKAIRDVLLQHALEYTLGSCLCGASCPGDDLWAEHVLDEIFKDEEVPADDVAVQQESSL